MSLKITIEGLNLAHFAAFKQSDIQNMVSQAARKHVPLVLHAWSNRITQRPGPRPTKDGKGRRPYKYALQYKVWKWTIGTGVTVVFGPSGREIPHAHLAEDGTKQRSRLPYYNPGKDRGGHGIRGRFEFVNFRGSRKHGRPPFPANHPILTTGAAVARKWKDQTIAQIGNEYATLTANTFEQLLISYINERLV